MTPVPLTFSLAGWRFTVVDDGAAWFRARAFFANAPDDAFDAALADLSPDAQQRLHTPFHCLLARRGPIMALIDCGLGPDGAPDSGNLLAALRAAGVAPGDVTHVILTHAHNDHMGGALTPAGESAFPGAQFVLSAVEWEFWHSPDAPPSASTIRARLAVLAPQLRRCAVEGELLPGVVALPAPGHSPGQIALRFGAPDEPGLLHTADVIAHPLHLAHADWHIIADSHPDRALITRRELLAGAHARGDMLFVYHFPAQFPAPLVRLTSPTASGWAWSPGP